MLINTRPFKQAAIDALYGNVSLLMHMESPNDSVALIDQKGHPYTGNVKASTTKFKFGTASARHEGRGSGISFANNSAFDLLAKDFCIEAWVNIESVASVGGSLLNRWAIGPGQAYDYIFNVNANGSLEFGSTASLSTPASSLPFDGQWHHVCVERFGSTFRIYVDGVVKATTTSTATIANNGTRPLRTGAWDDTNAGWTGYMDELRFTVGAARYKGAFTVPTQPFPDQ